MNLSRKNTAQRIALLTAGVVLLLYLGDCLWVRYRLAKGTAFETVKQDQFYAVPEKNNKVEFFYGDPRSLECVIALFPHLGDVPCWYANRKKDRRTDL